MMCRVVVREAHEGDAALLHNWRTSATMAVGDSPFAFPTSTDPGTWLRELHHDPTHLLLVIDVDGVPVGFASFAPHNDPAARELSVVLHSDKVHTEVVASVIRAVCAKASTRSTAKRVCITPSKGDPLGRAPFRAVGFRDSEPNVLELMLPMAIPHNRLTHGDPEAHAVADTVSSGRWAQGPRVAALEDALQTVGGVTHAIGVASGLSALRLALLALGVERGSRVVIPAYSCVALANAVLACGGHPVLADVEAGTWNISARTLHHAAKRQSVAAIIAVNTFGVPAPIHELRSVCEAPIVEDCAHAFGMLTDDGMLGSRGDAAVLSFYATKLMGAGEGGAVLTRQRSVAEQIARWRDYSDQPSEATRLNDKMTDLEAALALCQLERLPHLLAARHVLAHRYTEMLSPHADPLGFRLPEEGTGRVWYRYAVELPPAAVQHVIDGMHTHGVHTVRPVFDWRTNDAPSCPIADRAYASILSLPLYPTLTEVEQDRVVEAFLRACAPKRHAV